MHGEADRRGSASRTLTVSNAPKRRKGVGALGSSNRWEFKWHIVLQAKTEPLSSATLVNQIYQHDRARDYEYRTREWMLHGAGGR